MKDANGREIKAGDRVYWIIGDERDPTLVSGPAVGYDEFLRYGDALYVRTPSGLTAPFLPKDAPHLISADGPVDEDAVRTQLIAALQAAKN